MKYKRILGILLAVVLCAALMLPVLAENFAPVAVNAKYKTYAGVKLCGTLTAADAENEECTFEIVKGPKKGTLTLEGAGFQYIPKDGKTGKDSFTFTATDVSGNKSETGRVEIEICKRKANESISYSDMSESEAHFAALYLHGEGIMSGETFGNDSFFYPDKEVTRAQFVAMTAAITEMALPAVSVGTGLADNEDIPAWARPYVAAAISCGVVRGETGEDGNKVFRADDAITRAEAAAVISRALSLAADGREISLTDGGDIPSWASQTVVNTVVNGILPVFSDNTVRAQSPVTREDAAKMLYAMLCYQKEKQAGSGLFSRLWQ